uniref:Calciumdependent protein 2 putative n=1 Tax=Albugo laibachii Nc14 TaxID=890382 RepID=F0WAK0_9STRA|nr:calciumdependent protein 2 putative [Albugo laibachii Nc14]|eukprot:CCA18171.1 calciumdependent protein 2 putative [Albugo laibachii Nc14]
MNVNGLVSVILSSVLVQAYAEETDQTHRLSALNELAKHGVFVETFEQTQVFNAEGWVKSEHEKYASQDVEVEKYFEAAGNVGDDNGLVFRQPAKHYGVGAKLKEKIFLDGSKQKKELVVQYEVKLQEGLSCGGAYVKLLRADDELDLKKLDQDTPYVIMFGPDKCGQSDKVHFIFKHKNPVTGEYEEKHLKNPPEVKNDKLPHLYTLVVRDDNTFEVFIDLKSVSKGSFEDSFDPPVNPPKEIDDPEDSKPEDWVDEAKIPDPEASKPDDWDEDAPMQIPDEDAVKPADWLDDEPDTIADPDSEQPEDWDTEEDGDWIAPQIANPKCEQASGCGEWKRPTKANPAYKGIWKAPIIDNPAYKGEWAPRQITNPAFFEDEHPARMDPISAVGLEIWTMSEGITFDNFYIAHNVDKAFEFAKLTWEPKFKAEEAVAKESEPKLQDNYHLGRALEFLFHLIGLVSSDPLYAIIAAGILSLVSALAFSFCFRRIYSKKSSVKKDDPKPTEVTKTETTTDDKAPTSEEHKMKLRQRKKAPQSKDD